MKFVRFEYEGNVSIGMVKQEKIIVLDGTLFDTHQETGVHFTLSDVKLLPPVIPTKIVCIGLNFPGRIRETGARFPEKPWFFLKPPSSLTGHEDPIIFPRVAECVAYEGELAVVIKDKMKDVPKNETLNHILGCSCFNDVTESAIVTKDIADITLAKGFDTFSAFGPCLVNDLDPNNLDVKTYLNGKPVQHDNTRNCVFSIQEVLHYLSQRMTLCPGDIVAMGTPSGIVPMKPGDVVEVEVEGIGRLRNTVKLQDAV
jgi:2-keto-4-pentenoate hydratase/2-oxohepta-3-ene-1,7-dioic acid hydratase in catechol pathway